MQKHRVTFERAASIFKDSRAISHFDKEHSFLEERWITLGLDRNGVLLVICHTYRKERDDRFVVRIFSARKAAKSEVKQYEEL